MKKLPKIVRYLAIGLVIFLAVVIYAYGFKVTKVNLEETKSERRQTQLIRIIRALAKPEIFEYEKQEFFVTVPFFVPCQDESAQPAKPDKFKAYMIIDPTCADPKSDVTIEGFNFEPNSEGPIFFNPPSGANLRIADVVADSQGHFITTATIPNRPDDEAQTIKAVTRIRIGNPHFTRTTYDTLEKIIETVFLALLATTFGTIVAIPLSFLASRNLMEDVKSPLVSISLSLITIPVGFMLGAQIGGWAQQISQILSDSLLMNLVGILVTLAIAVVGFRWAFPQEEIETPKTEIRILRVIVAFISVMSFFVSLFILANLAIMTGKYLSTRLGAFGFLGSFLANIGEILNMLMILITALSGAWVLSSIGSRISKLIITKVPERLAKIFSILLSTIAWALLFFLVTAGLNWLYQFYNEWITIVLPVGLGAIIGLVLGISIKAKALLPIGINIYFIFRTIFNALRSIESLIMVIVFVVWVGIGPFAGVLALGVHTIAGLAKLFSEQVESILEGPVEAIKATGANRIQTIVYGVIPQIIPPYISYTMYRWDINVRMSTIIGFAGGGGIGFLLIQNINLLNYRAASVQMIAIALVVASMDYLSSKMREKVV